MKPMLLSNRSCPACGHAVRRLQRKADTSDRFAAALIDLPFWLLFIVGISIGMVYWLAGAISIAILAFALYLWNRVKSRYQCNACGGQFSHGQTIASSKNP